MEPPEVMIVVLFVASATFGTGCLIFYYVLSNTGLRKLQIGLFENDLLFILVNFR